MGSDALIVAVTNSTKLLKVPSELFESFFKIKV